MNGNNKIYSSIQNSNNKDKSTVNFSSLSLCKDLTKLGAKRNKSLTLEFPSDEIVPKKYKHHFIRGYFDGDGCIWNGKRKRMIVKDAKRKNGFRERIVHNVKFTFTGCISFIEAL